MAKVRIEFHKEGLEDLLDSAGVRTMMMDVGSKVAAQAAATAGSAEKTGDNYAQVGFSVEWQNRNKRPRVNVFSNAPLEVALRAHFKSQRLYGVGHLRAALYKFTRRG